MTVWPRPAARAGPHRRPAATQVTFDRFAQWLFDADHHWSDMIVLPEGQIREVRRALQHDMLVPVLTCPSNMMRWFPC